MTDVESSIPVPEAECEAGRARVKLPAGEWSLSITCEEYIPDRDIEPTPPPPPPPPSTISDRYTMATQNPDLYRKRLGKEMCRAFKVKDLKLISANLGFGLDFIGDQDREYECQRLIEKCMLNGFPMMQRLLTECHEMRKDRAFPKLPEDEELW